MNKQYFLKALKDSNNEKRELNLDLPPFLVLSHEDDTSAIDNLNADGIDNSPDLKTIEENSKPELIMKNSIEVANVEKELNDNCKTLDATVETEESLKEQIETHEEIIKSKPEEITPLAVNIAASSLLSTVKFLNLDMKDYGNLYDLREDYFSKENELSITPAQALNIVNEDMKDILTRTKEKLKQLWEAIVNGLKKLWEFITYIIFSIKKLAMKLKDLVQKNYPTEPDGTFEPYKICPTLAHDSINPYWKTKLDTSKIISYHKAGLVFAVSMSNFIGTSLKDELSKTASKETKEKRRKVIEQNFDYILQVLRTLPQVKDKRLVAVSGERWYYLDNTVDANILNLTGYFPRLHSEKIDPPLQAVPIKLLKKSSLLFLLDNIIQFDKKSYLENLKKSINNATFIKDTVEKMDPFYNKLASKVYTTLSTTIVKCEANLVKSLYKVCLSCYKNGVDKKDLDETIEVEVIG